MTWLTATEALRVLGVRPQTLYANVSRKKIRAKPDPQDTRRSLYHEVDVRKLARQHGGRRKAAAVAAGAIEWGDPILPSGVSTVVEGRLYYRGQDAVVLSQNAALEEVAALLWGGEAIDFDKAWRESTWKATTANLAVATAKSRGTAARSRGTTTRSSGKANLVAETVESRGASCDDSPALPALPLQRAFLALGQRASTDMATYGRSPAVLRAEAAGVLATLIDSMLAPALEPVSQGRRPLSGPHRLSRMSSRDHVRSSESSRSRSTVPHEASDSIHHRIALSLGRRGAADVIRRALVLLADHELNASTFATRVAVSTGAPLSAGVLSGLATLSGPLHGRAALGVIELVSAVERVGAERAVRDGLSQGRPTAGFGHPLYPDGDPRAVALLEHLTLPREYADLMNVVEEIIGERPNVDFSLAVLAKVHRLPPEAPLILFALGRCVGWLAHALEQVTTGQPIRPRARYVGPPIS